MKSGSGEIIYGRGAAPGLGLGRAWLWPPAIQEPPTQESPANPAPDLITIDRALARLRAATTRVQAELRELQQATAARAGEEAAAILGAQAMMAGDPELLAEVETRLRAGKSLPTALHAAGEAMAADLAALEDPYFQQRADDVRDVVGRLLAAITGGNGGAKGDVPAARQAPFQLPYGPQSGVSLQVPYADCVVVADEIPPSAIATLPVESVRAIVTRRGGATSHAGLLAKGLGIPAVMGCEGVLDRVVEGDLLAVDGDAGEILIKPDDQALQVLRSNLQRQADARAVEGRREHQPTITQGGRRIRMAANVMGLADTEAAIKAGAEAIGLLRTEFLFLSRTDLPDEEEQYQAYRAVLEAAGSRPVAVRTLDVGGDKPLPALDLPQEANPFLGWRGIRLWLDRPDLARPQIRALLRAARHGTLHILLPMVTQTVELQRARELIGAEQTDLGELAGSYKLGVMVEVPAAALLAEAWAPLVDFFSIGTNDLVQYTLAVDRDNPRVAHLNDPLHPAVLRLVELTIKGAQAHNKPVAVCGDAAADPQVIPTLVQLGVDELSVPPAALAAVRDQIRGLGAGDGS